MSAVRNHAIARDKPKVRKLYRKSYKLSSVDADATGLGRVFLNPIRLIALSSVAVIVKEGSERSSDASGF